MVQGRGLPVVSSVGGLTNAPSSGCTSRLSMSNRVCSTLTHPVIVARRMGSPSTKMRCSERSVRLDAT